MKKFDIFSFALSNFLRRKARSALTVLGVVIGTAAVVIMLSIGIGMNKGFEDQISSWGNLREISVYPKYGSWNEETGEYEQNASIVPLDDITVDELKQIKGVQAVSPRFYGYGTYIIKDNVEKPSWSSVQTIDAASMADFGYEVIAGRLLNEDDVGTTNFVMAYNLPFNFKNMRGLDWSERYNEYYAEEGEEFPYDPLDERVKYSFTWYWQYGEGAIDVSKPRIVPEDAKCVGILVQNFNAYGMDYDMSIYMDVKGYMALNERLQKNQSKYYGNSEDEFGYASIDFGYGGSSSYVDDRKNIYDDITVLVEDTDDVLDVSKAITDMGFQANSSMDYLQQMQEQTKFLRSILGAIGAVAFFVAAISIANTMVMSIYERTREIGIMKVIGCKLKDIRGMFLVEAAIIGIVGGALGVGLSYGLSSLVNKLAAGGGMEAFGIYSSDAVLSIIPFWLDIAALILATAVGVISGLYPAIRATRLSALEAIKNE